VQRRLFAVKIYNSRPIGQGVDESCGGRKKEREMRKTEGGWQTGKRRGF